uniref:Putative secreted protein n=1 Tax=Ixodes ricinus TaxID=34613 RepID=A0A147BET7_IXORI
MKYRIVQALKSTVLKTLAYVGVVACWFSTVSSECFCAFHAMVIKGFFCYQQATGFVVPGRATTRAGFPFQNRGTVTRERITGCSSGITPRSSPRRRI